MASTALLHHRPVIAAFLLFLSHGTLLAAAPSTLPALQDIRYPSAADHTEQPALWYAPPGDQPVPLLVSLHSWSGNYKQSDPASAAWCVAKGWVTIRPDFRGPNSRPEACGSELAVQDILSAVEWAKSQRKIDADRIYLIGGSGGGHMSLLMAGRSPQTWAAVSAWCPITDLARWHADSTQRKSRYAQMLEKSCGGAPGASGEVDRQYAARSPLTHLAKATGLPLDIATGIEDGHKGSVPVGHTLRAFNSLAQESDQIAEADIAAIEAKPQMPEKLLQVIEDLSYGRRKPLYRRTSGNARATVFQGGHEILTEAGLAWLEQQRKGKPAVWKIEKPDLKQ
jgi:dipeptidyl aminopeptidase/acylaminoacyl peptidase